MLDTYDNKNTINNSITTLSINSEKYPSLLKKIKSPPHTLYCKGDLSQVDFNKCLSIVGSREPTDYGVRVLEHLFKSLDRSITIVSGFMTGIDSLAHELALYHKMKTVAVLPCGINLEYPPRNRSLYRRILESGNSCIISEYPGSMYPLKWTFIKRNRILAGISLSTLIIEAALNSGSMTTATYAKDYNRSLLVIPGSIFSSKSIGCNYLIGRGGTIVNSSLEINKILTNLRLGI